MFAELGAVVRPSVGVGKLGNCDVEVGDKAELGGSGFRLMEGE